MIKHKFKLFLQIFLLITSIIAFADIMKEVQAGMPSANMQNKKIGLMTILFLALKIITVTLFNEKTLVSALNSDDLQKGTYTCIKSKDGSLCQEYPASECNSKCDGQCLPTGRENVQSCQVGTCFDPDSGICQERSTRESCEVNGGQWFDDPAGNVAQCQKSCCVVGDETVPLVTLRECQKIEETTGVTTTFRTDAKNEIVCWALGKTKVEGACVFESDNKCRFLTKGECYGNGGEFFEGILCTHPDFNMGYEKQATAKCVEGKDELYWFDSEGNRENIYDGNKVKSWNDGKVLIKEESCDISEGNNALGNQKTCGNCNSLLGSVCGQKTEKEKLSANGIDEVCRDTRCTDSSGNLRENGESWCEYQGDIGEDKGAKGFSRSADTPGSRHFRASCIDGEVQVNACADYRNEVCIESQLERGDGEKISNSACVTNLWQLCINYNSEVKGKGAERKAQLETRNDKCIKNPHCMLKQVDVADNFKFDLCVPRYAPGFDLKKNAEGGELSCAFANQKCTVFFVKELSGWEVKANEGCLKNGFAEQMNDMCMSLGDCGASVNYMGDLTKNYKVKNTKKLDKEYLNDISQYSDTVEGKYATMNVTQYIDSVGGLEKSGFKKKDPNCNLPVGCELVPDTDVLQTAGTISGLAGSALLLLAGTDFAAGFFVAIPGSGVASLSGIAAPLAGAAIGFAVTSLLIQLTGIGGGLDPAVTWTLIAAGTVGGAIIGTTVIAAGGLKAAGATCAAGGVGCIVGVVILIVVVLIIVIFKALGIGDTKKKVVRFQCQPWQPILGGAKCGECGKDGYDCSRYSCHSLGQTCELINEGTSDEKCIDLSPNDVSAPIISPWKEALNSGFKYEENNNGMKIISSEEDGCIKSYENVIFGISLNEPGYCKYDVKNNVEFEEMEFDFGDRNLFLTNHSQLFAVPDLSSLGLPGYDPNRRSDFSLYTRCIDGNGNGKDSAEYAINFCIKPGVDKTPPIIAGREPILENAPFNASKIDAKVFINEPAECKWSLDSNKDYENMENSMECLSDVEDRESIFGWECSTTFEIDKNENSFFIKCLDQPWKEENNSERNVMINPYEYKIIRTTNPLIINSVKPNNETLIFGVEPASVTLELTTSGGVDGRATCKLFGKAMGETYKTTHKQIFNKIFSGNYEFPIECEDTAGNTALATSKFEVNLDSSPPSVSRVYKQGESLVIVTNEDAECSYLKFGREGEECLFDFKNGTIMSGREKIHSTPFDKGKFYVKCKDKWGYVPGTCSVVVNGGDYELQ
ncbi:MAG: hypothetical protein Q7S27_06970 [Nanoarchaeota archaeon]|nr:hypothetical protein [Nanoarchaeota archaeon]